VPVADLGLERLLTSVRAVMLTAATAEQALDARQMKFYSAVAQQCFINEYVFSLAEGEDEQAQRIVASLEKALQSGAPVPAMWPIVVAAYFPLHTLTDADALGTRSWPDGVEDLMIQQVSEPRDEQELRAAIPAITAIDADVSLAVRQQYEENPYPRWVTAGPPAQSVSLVGAPGQTLEILIAGCGTGQYAIEFARDALDARFLAVDLSLASLGYAKRMALKFGLFNIEFAQADSARLTAIGRTFDVIEASGVLHHMADPWQGWRQLLTLLRPGGVMQVGLYSALARQNVVAARDLIAQRDYRPIPQDIRRCREELAAAEDGSLLKSLTRWPDFFTMSACRDLLFHTQEHRLTLPQIKAFLAENNLTFAGFVIDEPIERKFAARFPGDAALNDLDCWNVYETENPLAFAKMYQFWVQLNR
jgi:SAM-dependent methyltransferase